MTADQIDSANQNAIPTMSTHRRRTLGGALLAGGAFLLLLSCDGAAPSQQTQVERGAYLVHAVGCADCHTPHRLGENGPEPDPERHLSGHPASMSLPPAPQLPEGPWAAVVAGTMTAWSGPWGVSYTANLTPHATTGLGAWNADTFKRALRTGRHMGVGRPILPPMPWSIYRNFTDEDLDAIFAYLQSIPAIDNRVPEPLPPATAGSAAEPAGAR